MQSNLALDRLEARQKAIQAAHAGFAMAAFDVISTGDASGYSDPLKPHELQFKGVQLRVSVEREVGKLDLNRADQIWIDAVLRRVVVGAEVRFALMDAVRAFRMGGREDAPLFWSITHWIEESGIDPADTECLDRWFTVHSSRTKPKPNAVSSELANILVSFAPDLYGHVAAQPDNENHSRPDRLVGEPLLFRVFTQNLSRNSGLITVIVLPGHQSGHYQTMRWESVAGGWPEC